MCINDQNMKELPIYKEIILMINNCINVYINVFMENHISRLKIYTYIFFISFLNVTIESSMVYFDCSFRKTQNTSRENMYAMRREQACRNEDACTCICQ